MLPGSNILMHIHIILLHHSPLKSSEQSSNKQARLLLSVLAVPPSLRIGLYSTLAIFYPNMWPFQIQSLSLKLTSGGPGFIRQIGSCCPKAAHLQAKNSHFGPKTALEPIQNGQMKGNGPHTPRAA